MSSGKGLMNAVLKSGEQLALGEFLTSPDNKAKLILQDDGNLVLYRLEDGFALWSTQTQGKGVVRAVIQPDNNFVLLTPNGPAWHTETSHVAGGGKPGGWIQVQDDGNIAVYNAENKALWASWSSLTDWQRCQVLEAGPNKDGSMNIRLRSTSTPTAFDALNFKAHEATKREMLTVALTALSSGMHVSAELTAHKHNATIASLYISPGF
ncbi:hypothetical protein ACH9D2_06600 [Kocuria sp. M4R2S49]|uniref:hypothetical protein n=1 Tax=Kocuria rhizosphaericola TaxID=3376284 RepID=UPI00379EAFDD